MKKTAPRARKRPAHPRLRSDVADDQAMRTTGESAVGDQPDRLAQPLADQRCRHRQQSFVVR